MTGLTVGNVGRLAQRYGPVKLSYDVYGEWRASSRNSGRLIPPLLIVDGLFGHKSNWRTISQALHRRLQSQVVSVDLRNHGASPRTSSMEYFEMAADLELLIESEILNMRRKVALLGHSMGGKLATVLALMRQDLIDSLFIVDVTPKNYMDVQGGPTEIIPALIESMLEIADSLKFFTSYGVARKFAEEKLKDTLKHQQTVDFLLTNLVKENGEIKWQMNLEAIQNNLNSFLRFPEFDRKIRFDRPTLVISGENSPYRKKEDKPILRRYFPEVEFVTIESAGHWVHVDAPESFVDVVEKKLLTGRTTCMSGVCSKL